MFLAHTTITQAPEVAAAEWELAALVIPGDPTSSPDS